MTVRQPLLLLIRYRINESGPSTMPSKKPQRLAGLFPLYPAFHLWLQSNLSHPTQGKADPLNPLSFSFLGKERGVVAPVKVGTRREGRATSNTHTGSSRAQVMQQQNCGNKESRTSGLDGQTNGQGITQRIPERSDKSVLHSMQLPPATTPTPPPPALIQLLCPNSC